MCKRRRGESKARTRRDTKEFFVVVVVENIIIGNWVDKLDVGEKTLKDVYRIFEILSYIHKMYY